ncbi:MAG: succinylglutamate desuccinylase/aspartoacylase family protein [Cyclobacteriaceae bacterium]
MINVHSKALDQSIEVDRMIGHLKGLKPGPTLIFTGGIHGNEPSGVFALQRVLSQVKNHQLRGSVYAIAGNLWALERGVRFDKEDLNRVWTKERIQALSESSKGADNEDVVQQMEIYQLLISILKSETGPFYFFDLHTTSSETIPFLTVNDSILNRKFTIQYPIPIILGIEEYLDGPLLSYINEKGYVAFGYEAGQHDSMSSIENHISFIYLSMVFCGTIEREDINFHTYYDKLAKTTGDVRHIYEIYYRYLIKPDEEFKMRPGFFNFQRVRAGEVLAESNQTVIKAEWDGRIFMPLYQPQGAEGFFTIRKILPVFLILSALFRKIRLDHLLTLLPGVTWHNKQKHALIVNRKIAMFFTKQFFHLLGYRAKQIGRKQLIMKNRERKSRDKEYENESWYVNS